MTSPGSEPGFSTRASGTRGTEPQPVVARRGGPTGASRRSSPVSHYSPSSTPQRLPTRTYTVLVSIETSPPPRNIRVVSPTFRSPPGPILVPVPGTHSQDVETDRETARKVGRVEGPGARTTLGDGGESRGGGGVGPGRTGRGAPGRRARRSVTQRSGSRRGASPDSRGTGRRCTGTLASSDHPQPPNSTHPATPDIGASTSCTLSLPRSVRNVPQGISVRPEGRT